MADKIEDGGRAFPSDWDQLPGMDLRDFFACHALSAFGGAFIGSGWHNPNEYQISDMVRSAYRTADAMLKARKGEL